MINFNDFMIESNRIEGDIGLNPGDLDAIEYVQKNGLSTEENILELHKILTDFLNVEWSGKYRQCMVYVGDSIPPHDVIVPKLMKELFENFNSKSSWELHNEFERIHPFQDFNGRVGRLLWLYKALKEGYTGSIPFLQKYYYQTLSYWSFWRDKK